MSQIYRVVHRAQAAQAQVDAAGNRLVQLAATPPLGSTRGDLTTISIFQWQNHFFTYWESIDEPVMPDAIFGDVAELLLPWPGAASPRYFVPMMDIFHYVAAASAEQWQRKTAVEQSFGRLARLQPAMVSSYIFYHYQLQEEKPGSGDKYGLISFHENLIFFYQERPTVLDSAPPPGKLQSHNTPDHWHDVMFPHFDRWADAEPGQEIWRETALLLHR